MSSSLSPLIHLIDDDEAVRSSLALLISTVGLRVQAWADPQDPAATGEGVCGMSDGPAFVSQAPHWRHAP